jgi:hypothetical protein
MHESSIDGVVLIVQEGRFQLQDDDGVSHQFEMSFKAPFEPEQLVPLRQRRVRVHYQPAENVIGLLARDVELLDE